MRISKRLCNVLILFFAAKGARYHMLFFTCEDMACLARKLTSYFIGVYIISSGNVIKCKLFLHPLQSNHEHLFLQGEECLYLNTGDMVSDTQDLIENTGTTPVIGGPVGHSTLVSNKQWIVIQVRAAKLDSQG